jgi:hypothetical protein
MERKPLTIFVSAFYRQKWNEKQNVQKIIINTDGNRKLNLRLSYVLVVLFVMLEALLKFPHTSLGLSRGLSPCSLELISQISQLFSSVFSHNKSANSTFSNGLSAKRTGPF